MRWRLRLSHDRATHRDQLPLAARERARLAVEELRETEHVGRFPYAAVDLGLRRLSQPETECDVLVHRQVGVERVALEDHRDVAIARGTWLTTRPDPQHALGDVLQPGDHAERGRLAAAGRADEHHELSVADLEIHPRYRAGAVGIDLADPLEGYGSHQVSGRHYTVSTTRRA